MKNLLKQLPLCFVTNSLDKKKITDALRGGVTMIQWREKRTKYRQKNARWIQEILKKHPNCQIPLIINDDIRLAKAINADGVHLGQTDDNVTKAREILGPNKMIGLSIESFKQLEQANTLPIDYVTASAVFLSQTKPDCRTLWGLHDLAKLVQMSAHPITAIGGINTHNATQVIRTGVHGIAVVGAIQNAPHPDNEARRLITAFHDHTPNQTP